VEQSMSALKRIRKAACINAQTLTEHQRPICQFICVIPDIMKSKYFHSCSLPPIGNRINKCWTRMNASSQAAGDEWMKGCRRGILKWNKNANFTSQKSQLTSKGETKNWINMVKPEITAQSRKSSVSLMSLIIATDNGNLLACEWRARRREIENEIKVITRRKWRKEIIATAIR
jgi:hypothetical protein